MNINDIAKLSGVSRATVSRYLNGGYVSNEKKALIKAVLDETGYTPSTQAQMLRNKKTKLIGVIIPKIHSESISRMVAGISEGFSGSDYQLIMANTFNDAKEELKYLKTFKENKVDGIILIGTTFSKEHYQAMKALKVPIVVLGQQVDGYACVYHDNYHAAKDISKLLLNNYQKGDVACLHVLDEDKSAGLERKLGFIDECHKLAISDDKIVEVECGFTFDDGYEAMKKALGISDKLQAVFCATDTIAMGAMTYAKEKGYRIPDDLKFVGIGDSRLAKAILPSLTTVHLHYKTAGQKASAMLLKLINKEELKDNQLIMDYAIVENQSV